MTSLLKFFIVIVLVQGATAALMVGAVDPRFESAWFFFASSAFIIAVLATIWFHTRFKRMKNAARARTREEFIAEREALLLKTEREKRKVVEASHRERQKLAEQSHQQQQRLLEESHRRVTRETGRVRTYAGIKLWVALAALAALGSVLIFAQFITFGALALSGAGGTLIGYSLRARQGRLAPHPESPAAKPGLLHRLLGRSDAAPGRGPSPDSQSPPRRPE
ncbi:MAG: hypothetical protein U5S82_02000 [Gammaproteobacteria bacterium]|nr:hypothetical protein [Gammaproteobacteria bacterium]